MTPVTPVTDDAPAKSGGGAPLVAPPPGETQKVVQISFPAGRDALFTAWNAAANSADMAGKVNVTLRAESEQGFYKIKLQNENRCVRLT